MWAQEAEILHLTMQLWGVRKAFFRLEDLGLHWPFLCVQMETQGAREGGGRGRERGKEEEREGCTGGRRPVSLPVWTLILLRKERVKVWAERGGAPGLRQESFSLALQCIIQNDQTHRMKSFRGLARAHAQTKMVPDSRPQASRSVPNNTWRLEALRGCPFRTLSLLGAFSSLSALALSSASAGFVLRLRETRSL